MRKLLDTEWKGFGEVALLVDASFLYAISTASPIPVIIGDGMATTAKKSKRWNVELYGFLKVNIRPPSEVAVCSRGFIEQRRGCYED